MERDARPGDALHVWHGSIAVEVRVVRTVLLLFLKDAVDAGRRSISRLAAGPAMACLTHRDMVARFDKPIGD